MAIINYNKPNEIICVRYICQSSVNRSKIFFRKSLSTNKKLIPSKSNIIEHFEDMNILVRNILVKM